MKSHSIAVIDGDGIGPEVIEAGIRVINTISKKQGDFEIDWKYYDFSSKRYKETGVYIPPNGLEELKKHDAIFFGAVGAADIPDHISLWNLILPIRQSFQLYANVRPLKIFPGTTPPLAGVKRGDIDWVIVRENSEGEYSGQGGRSHIHEPHEVATELAIFSRVGIERIMRFAFDTARSRPRKLLTVVTKSNAQRYGLVLWDEIALLVAKDYPDVTCDKMLVDAMTCRMVANPKSLDTIVATNLHGDILSDLGAALTGSIGIAASSNLDPSRKHPSMFEPVHGAAFDLIGKDLANPVATFWSASEMLKWLGEHKAAETLMSAVEKTCEQGNLTKDLGGKLGTKQVTDSVIKLLTG